MTSSPDLIHELRASRPAAPAELRARVREIAAEQPRPGAAGPAGASRSGAARSSPCPAAPRSRSRAQASIGLARSDGSQRDVVSATRAPTDDARAQPPQTRRERCDRARAGAQPDAVGPATDRAQRVSATLTVEVAGLGRRLPRRAGRARPHALARRLRRHRRRSRPASEGSASITVRVPVARVQDAIAGLSGLGRIVSQQVTIDDLQETLDALERRRALARAQIARITARLESETLDAETRGGLEARLQTLRSELRGVRAQHRRDERRGADVDDPAHRRDARTRRRGRAAVAHRPHDRRGAERPRLGGRRRARRCSSSSRRSRSSRSPPGSAAALYRRHEEERLLAT